MKNGTETYLALQINYKYITPLLIAFGAILYIPFIGSVHLFDWDEINFAECAREMIVTGDYLRVLIDFEDFHQKPPLFIWMQVLSMKLFGINEFAARFPNAIAGIINLLLLYSIGKEIRNKKFGLLWALAHGLSFLPFLYFKSGIIDPWFNLFIFSGILAYLYGLDRQNLKWIGLSGIFIGLAVLTKGPVGLIIFGLAIGLAVLSKKLWWALNWKRILSFALPFIIAGSSWFILIAIAGKSHIIYDFIDYQIRLFSTEDAGHGGPFYYHEVVLLIGCFPASIFALKPLFKKKEDFYETAILWSLLGTLILFSIVETKIIHYSSFCYYGLSFFAAKQLYNTELNKWLKAGLITVASIWFLLFLTIALLGINMAEIDFAGIVRDKFALANMSAKVDWGLIDLLPAIFMLLALIVLIFKNKQIIFWLATSLAIYSFLVLIVPKIEAYSQRAAIGYFESVAEENCEIYTYGYKSYAHLFYAKKLAKNKDSELQYLVCKNTKKEKLESEFANAELIESKNGYMFYRLK